MIRLSHRRPARMDDTLTGSLIFWLEDEVQYAPLKRAYLQACIDGWNFVVADHRRSFCNYQNRLICISTYHWKLGKDYCLYILAHELAHKLAGWSAAHGIEFMKQFKYLCPHHLQHHELDYKPASALAAGIMPADF